MTPQTEAETIDLLARSLELEKAKQDAVRVQAFALMQAEIEALRKEARDAITRAEAAEAQRDLLAGMVVEAFQREAA